MSSPCPVSLSVLQRALTLSLHLNPMTCPLCGRMWARVRPALRLTSLLRLDTGWHFLLVRFKVLHAGLTLGGSAVFTQSLSVPSCPPDNLVRRPTSCSHISPSSRERKKSISESYGFAVLLFLSFHLRTPPPNGCKGFPGGTLLRNPPASKRCRRCAFDPWVWEDPLEKEMATHSSILA